MTNCSACASFEQNRKTGAYQANCLECKARSIANSPTYWESARAGNISAAYRKVLDRVFKGDWAAGHAQVKRIAALIRGRV